MKKLQLASGIVIVAFAAVICFEANKLSFGTPRNPGPGFLPLAYGIMLLLLAVFFVLKTILHREKTSHFEESPWSGLSWRQVPGTLAILLGYALLLNRLGYLVSTWMLMGFLFWGEGPKRKSYAVIASLAVSVASSNPKLIIPVLISIAFELGLGGIDNVTVAEKKTLDSRIFLGTGLMACLFVVFQTQFTAFLLIPASLVACVIAFREVTWRFFPGQ